MSLYALHWLSSGMFLRGTQFRSVSSGTVPAEFRRPERNSGPSSGPRNGIPVFRSAGTELHESQFRTTLVVTVRAGALFVSRGARVRPASSLLSLTR